MQSKILETPVDKLVELVKNNRNCSVDFLILKLNLPAEIVEKWLVVLEEFQVLRVKYKGFEGFVDISRKEEDKIERDKSKVDVDNLKDIFMQKSKENNLTFDKMRKLWPIFISEYERDIKQLFEDKAKKMGYEIQKIEIAWMKYKKELERF